MLSCLSFVSQEKYGSGEKKIKNPNVFLCQQSISWQWPVLVCVCRGLGGVSMDLVPLVGFWGQVKIHGGSSQSWRVTSPQQRGLCLCCGQSKAREAARVLSLVGDVCDHHQVCSVRQIPLFLKHLVCVILSYRHCHLSAATLVLSRVQCSCRGSFQEPKFSVPSVCEFNLIIFMIFLRGLLVFY